MFTVNEYFDGKVKSLAFTDSEGPATVGVIDAGEYEFGTATKEIMNVVSGTLNVLLPGTDQWKHYAAGTAFTVSANQKFKVKAIEPVSYLCWYR
jgi:uncharacterized protein YaiE (UPF0345 family)